jgi:hypothetical protein
MPETDLILSADNDLAPQLDTLRQSEVGMTDVPVRCEHIAHRCFCVNQLDTLSQSEVGMTA